MIIERSEKLDEKDTPEKANINNFSLKEGNDDNILEEIIVNENEILDEKKNTINKKKKKNYKLKYTEMLDYMTKNDKKNNLNNNEFLCNILLTPSEINYSDEISTLSLLTYCYQENEKKELIYKTARIFEQKQSKKIDIDPVFFLRVYFRSAYFLEIDKQYVYSIKYLKKCGEIIKKKPSNLELINEHWKSSVKGINKYLSESKKNFLKNPKFFSPSICHEIKELVMSILNKTYGINENEIVYAINKNWLNNLINYLNDYIISIERKTFDKLEECSFNADYFFQSYFNSLNDNTKGKEEKDVKNKKEKETKKFSAFPGTIDNYFITEMKIILLKVN